MSISLSHLVQASQICPPVSTNIITFKALGITATNNCSSLLSGHLNSTITCCGQDDHFLGHSSLDTLWFKTPTFSVHCPGFTKSALLLPLPTMSVPSFLCLVKCYLYSHSQLKCHTETSPSLLRRNGYWKESCLLCWVVRGGPLRGGM